MKKIIFILFVFLFHINSFSQQDSTNAISEFSAKLKKSTIYLQWVIRSLPEITKIKLDVKNPGEKVYRFLDDINAENYSKKTTKDSEEYHIFNYSYKPFTNGVYFFRISLNDKNLKTRYTDEIKIGVSEITEFKLFQNSPNPFNPVTSISYELFVQEKVTLKIYSLDGREIETLVDENQSPGTYKVDFNAGELSSGIYFYKLQTEHSSDIKKMIFTK